MSAFTIQCLKTALTLAIVVINSPVCAESAGAAIKEFGLVGTWSTDCAKIPGKSAGEVLRLTFAVSFLGSVTISSIYKAFNPTVETATDEANVKSAVKVTEDKIKIVMVTTRSTNGGVAVEAPPTEETVILTKMANKINLTGDNTSNRGAFLERCLN